MNWGAFDLNLLVVFDAVMRERSVTRAGARIGLSQPAMSHALNRLRYMLKDELFIRTPKGMEPTPRAEQLAGPLRQALADLQRALEPEGFDPAASGRSFTVAVNNYAAITLVPGIVKRAASAAPHVRLDLRPSGTLDILELLDRGELDLAIADLADPGERFACTTLVEDGFVVMMRRNHPTGRRPLTAASLAALAHLEISSSREDIGFLDDWLAEGGETRRIACRAPYLAAARILSGSDLVTVVSRRIAEEFQRSSALQLRELPFAAPRTRAVMTWHRRLENQPAHRWLRQTVADSCQAPQPRT